MPLNLIKSATGTQTTTKKKKKKKKELNYSILLLPLVGVVKMRECPCAGAVATYFADPDLSNTIPKTIAKIHTIVMTTTPVPTCSTVVLDILLSNVARL